MSQLSVHEPLKNDHPVCSDLTTMAEQELAAFFSAVTELYGSEEARLSAEDWLDELAAINDLPASPREWRLITIEALSRLSSRVNTSSASTAGLRSVILGATELCL